MKKQRLMRFQDSILCPFCGDEVNFDHMDSTDLREWEKSRLCLRCMNETVDRVGVEEDFPVMSERRRKDLEWGEINNEERYVR